MQEYLLIAFDAFRENRYDLKRSELNGWLSLLAVEDVDKAEALLEDYRRYLPSSTENNN